MSDIGPRERRSYVDPKDFPKLIETADVPLILLFRQVEGERELCGEVYCRLDSEWEAVHLIAQIGGEWVVDLAMRERQMKQQARMN